MINVNFVSRLTIIKVEITIILSSLLKFPCKLFIINTYVYAIEFLFYHFFLHINTHAACIPFCMNENDFLYR